MAARYQKVAIVSYFNINIYMQAWAMVMMLPTGGHRVRPPSSMRGHTWWRRRRATTAVVANQRAIYANHEVV